MGKISSMSITKIIKNNLWQYSYILPFVRKYKQDDGGNSELVKHVFQAYKDIKPIRVRNKESVGANIKELFSRVKIELDSDSPFVYFLDTSRTIAIPGNVLGNFTLAYTKIISGTFDEIVSSASGNDEYGRETSLAADGIRILVSRILETLKSLNHPHNKTKITFFNRMLSSPAEHFDEALQRILFFNQVLWQTRHRLNGLGRLDFILDDLYKQDIAKGILTEDYASALVRDFLMNLSRYSDYKSDALQGDIGQIIILGGTNADGSYFHNKLTEIFLREQANLAKPDPKIFLRVNKRTPHNLLELAVDCLEKKTGSPLFSNDDVVIPALIESGIDEEDAYSYSVSACWEPLVVGKSIAQNNIASFDFVATLNEVLNEDVSSFEELLKKYNQRNEKVFKEKLCELNSIKWAKDPIVSLFMDDSIKRRLDVSRGGCKYPNYGMTTVALSNAVDSLLTIRSLVFEQRKYSLQQLNEAIKKNYDGQEELLKLVQGQKKSFGHDLDEVINLVNNITENLSEIAKVYRNPLGGTVKFGLSSPDYNILCQKTSSDLSGRKAGEPYNTHISCRDASYTELVNFAGKLDYSNQRYNGNVVDFFISPGLISNNKNKFITFMIGAIKSGFFQMQMNVMDSQTLIDAKAHPDKYKGLIVRVWGFSAYFNELPESYKDLMIERALAAEKIA